jgi:tetratricopeptide (TPR) repeat protein
MPATNPELAVDDFRRRLLRFDAGAESILLAAARFPDAPMVQLCAATLHLYGQTAPDDAAAAAYLDAAERSGAAATAPHFLRALRLWHARRHDDAASQLEAATRLDPDDLLAAKVCEFLYYILGQQYCGPRFRAHIDPLAQRHPGDPDVLSMQSFAHELCGDLASARALAERSLALDARNPWAQHTLSHVAIRLGETEEGERRLRAFLPVAATCSRPIHVHTAWHVAMFDLERLDYGRALAILHSDIWGVVPDMVGEQVDAIALLWRLEMAGGEAGAAWGDIADHVEARCGEAYMPFLSAHHVYALVRAGRAVAVQTLCATVAHRLDDPVWKMTGQAVVLASVAFGEGRWADAAALLDPVMARITTIGGSDAQDDLFRQMYVVALAKAGRGPDARAFFNANGLPGRRPTPLDARFLHLTM